MGILKHRGGGKKQTFTKKENGKPSCHNIPKSFSLTISNALQFLSQPDELHVKLNILIANFFNSGQSSPYESHHSADTCMNYNILGLRIYSTTNKDEFECKTKNEKQNCYLAV